MVLQAKPEPQRWETFLRTSGNPRIPTTVGEAVEDALTTEEAVPFERHVRSSRSRDVAHGARRPQRGEGDSALALDSGFGKLRVG